jgi:transcriptional regulator with XRE-family HTH domain
MDAQAKRLIATRLALGYESQVEFCKAIGIEKNLYNPFEKAKRPITVDAARKIKRRFHIPLDWTIDGDAAYLPLHLARKLAAG